MKAKLSETAKVTVGVKVTVAVQIPAVQEVSVMALKVPWARRSDNRKSQWISLRVRAHQRDGDSRARRRRADCLTGGCRGIVDGCSCETMATSESRRPSSTLKGKLSEPLKFRFGV